MFEFNTGELAFIELVGDFCGLESTSFVLISCLVANRCVVGVIGISVVNVLTPGFAIKVSSSASGLAISSDISIDCLTDLAEFRSNGITFSSGITFGTKAGTLSFVGLSGWTGDVEDAGFLERSVDDGSCGVSTGCVGFLSGMIGISFGGGWLIASIGGDDGYIGGEDGVSESSVVLRELRLEGGWDVLKDISGMIEVLVGWVGNG